MFYVRQFLASRRAAVALESAIAAIPLVFALGGVFEIIRTAFVSDLLQRAAYRIARENAFADTAAPNKAELRSLVQRAITAELDDLLDFALANTNGDCAPPEAGEDQPAYCLKVDVDVYDPEDLGSTKADAPLGGDAGDMVVVRLHLRPLYALGRVQQRLFGDDGLRAMALMRNERRQELSV